MADQKDTGTGAIEKASKTAKELEFVPFGQPDPIRLSIKMIQELIATKTKSGQTCSETEAIRLMMLCQSQRLNPWTNDVYLVGYDSKDGTAKYSLLVSHASLLKRAEGCPDYEGMESGIIFRPDKDGPVNEREGDFYLPPEITVGGWAKVFRKGRHPTYRRLSIAAMKPMYETPFWAGDKAAGQIVKCAEADALRSTFPSLLAGLFIVGEQRAAIETEITTKAPEQTGLQKALAAGSPGRKAGSGKSDDPHTETAQPASSTEAMRAGVEGKDLPKDYMERKNLEKKPLATGAANPAPADATSGEAVPSAGSPAPDNGEFKARAGESEVLTNVRYLLHKFKKTEDALLSLGRKKTWAKEGQKLADLSETKLKQVSSAWDSILLEMNKA